MSSPVMASVIGCACDFWRQVRVVDMNGRGEMTFGELSRDDARNARKKDMVGRSSDYRGEEKEGERGSWMCPVDE